MIHCTRCGCEFPARLGEQGCPSCSSQDDGFQLTPSEPQEPKIPKVDPRFELFRQRIFAAYQWRWNAEPRWGGMEGNQLHRFLAENPNITEGEFSIALRNLVISDDVPERQRPGFWLPKLDAYLHHPHNTFGRNPHAPSTFTDQAVSRTEQSAQRYLANKKRSDRGLPAEPKPPELGQSPVERKRLRGVGEPS